jgi:prepilin-type N-terminal cleavage/methylation domain-containing protein
MKIVKCVRGFTLVELLVITAILGILALISLSQYNKHVDSAKRTVGINAMNNIRKEIEQYYNDHGSYPATFNVATCVDDTGKQIVSAFACEVLKRDLLSIDTYALTATGYSLAATAKDTAHTVITITPTEILY